MSVSLRPPPAAATASAAKTADTRMVFSGLAAATGIVMVGGWAGTGGDWTAAVPAAGVVVIAEGVRQMVSAARARSRPVPAASTDSASTDPAMPADAQPGWVYRDSTNQWVVVVETAQGLRFARLGDRLRLLEPGQVGRSLSVQGGLELRVIPMRQSTPHAA